MKLGSSSARLLLPDPVETASKLAGARFADVIALASQVRDRRFPILLTHRNRAGNPLAPPPGDAFVAAERQIYFEMQCLP